MQYNWLMRRNKAIGEELPRFANDLHGYMMSGGRCRRARSPLARAAGGPPGRGRSDEPAVDRPAPTSTTRP